MRTDEKAKKSPFVSLSFDDGRKDNITIVAPMLKRYGIPATFNITTSYVDGSSNREANPCENEPMSVRDIKELFSIPDFEIACHGDTHCNDLASILKGREKLSEWLGLDLSRHVFGFASPESLIQASLLPTLKKEGFAYIRTGMSLQTLTGARTFSRRFSSYVIPSRIGFLFAYMDTLKAPIANDILHSLPITRRTTLRQVIGAIEWASHHNKPIILMFHSILTRGDTFYSDPWSWDVARFDKLCKYLNKGHEEGAFHLSTTMDGHLSLEQM